MTGDDHPEGLANVLAAIDAANGADPSRISVGGEVYPAALIYGKRMSACLEAYQPTASLALRMAARGQHIERWTIPRKSYPEGRIGYLTWRKELQRFHARRLAEIVMEYGLGQEMAERVGHLVRKEQLVSDAETQILEDVACFVFLDHYFDPFAAGQSDEKLATILAKTWRKMSERAHRSVEESSPPRRILDLLAAGLEGLERRIKP